jgi:hypothetical protein
MSFFPGRCDPRTFIPRPMTSGIKTEAFEVAALVSRGIAMMRRAILAFAALIALGQTATAGVSCAVVRFYVAKYSEAAAETWARSHGASDAEIETARRCLHPRANVQTASTAAKSQVPASVLQQEHARNEPDKRDPVQDASHIVSVQDQRADPGKDSHDGEPRVDGIVRPKEIEDPPVVHVSHEVKDLVPSDRKTSTLRPRYVRSMHRAHSRGVTSHVAWFKRLWDHVAGRRRSSIALFASPRWGSYKVRHHLSATVPGHRAG